VTKRLEIWFVKLVLAAKLSETSSVYIRLYSGMTSAIARADNRIIAPERAGLNESLVFGGP
jgi:hypothetical protein